MKTHQKITVVGFIICITLLFCTEYFPSYREQVFTFRFAPLFGSIGKYIDEAEKEREEKIANGEEELRIGRDTCIQWKDKYEIVRVGLDNEKVLAFYGEEYGHVLEKVKGYKKTKEALYVASQEGYAVIDKNKICRVFITLPKEAFENGYTIDSKGNRMFNTTPIESDYIKYLDSFDQFYDHEQDILKDYDSFAKY